MTPESSTCPAHQQAWRTSRCGESISTARIHATSTPAAAHSVDTCRPSASTSISRPWRREGQSPTACRWLAVRARQCSPIRRVYLRVSTCAASLQTDGGPSAGTRHRRMWVSRSCPSTASGRCEHFRIPTRPRRAWAAPGHRMDARSKTWSSATERATCGGSRSTARRPGPSRRSRRSRSSITGGHRTGRRWRCRVGRSRRMWC